MTGWAKPAPTIACICLAVLVAAIISGNTVFIFAACGLGGVLMFAAILSPFYSADARRLKAAWESFPEFPGEHLRWHKTARDDSQAATLDGRVLATVDGVHLFGTWIPQRLPYRVQVDLKAYLITGGAEEVRIARPGGSVVLSFTGRNFDHQANAVAHMPDGQTLRFPVEGTTRGNAVMTATGDSGLPVFRVRRLRGTGPGRERKNMAEIVVEPGRQITNELLLAVIAGYHNLYWFFAAPYSGG